jgi:hypothetical protein
MSHRLAASGGLVLAEDHMFCLVDMEAPGPGGPGTDPQAPLAPLVTVGAGLGLATFTSELQDNEPYVDLEYWSAEPPDPDGPWESSARDQLNIGGGRLTLTSGVSMLSAPHDLELPPGRYHIAVWCRGRAEARAAELEAIETETLPQGVEQWLVRLWPVT